MSLYDNDMTYDELREKIEDLGREVATLKAKALDKDEPEWVSNGLGREDGYAAAQEQAAKVCDDMMLNRDPADCAAAIRAMKEA
jgi:hypothetical protein